jgi:Tfp pilus tip-associated adhesin PilY1
VQTNRLSNQDPQVSLLKHEILDVEVEGEEFRVFVDENSPQWLVEDDLDPNQIQNPVKHAGYFIDLPPGERVIRDVIIRNKAFIAISFRPDRNPCKPGGESMFMEINAFTGGTTNGSLFDISGDQAFTEADKVAVTIDGDEVFKIAIGWKFLGNLQSPVFVRLPDSEIEKKFLSSTTGEINVITNKARRLGVTYWRELFE